MPYPKFTKVIINHFLINHNTLPKRQRSFINTIKYDSVLGKLKFVNKGEEHQKYGMSISGSMMNDEIRNSAYYMTYLALSTNTEKEKINDVVKKKDIIPRKKRSITVADNILPNPEEAVKLAESISLTEAEHQDEKHRLHETHVSIIIGREAKEVANTVDSDKTEDEEEDRASKQDYRIQQHPKGLSEGSRVILEVPDKPRDIFDKSDRGSDDEKIADKEIVNEEMDGAKKEMKKKKLRKIEMKMQIKL
ncbi:hypothetical protein Tco_0034006 [Tanacetum coccineum]